jgi:hypothetical protein
MAGRGGSHISIRLPVAMLKRIEKARCAHLTHAASDSEFVRTWVDIVLLSITGRYGPPSPFDPDRIQQRLKDAKWHSVANRRNWRKHFPEAPIRLPPKEPVLGATRGSAITSAQAELIDLIRSQQETLTKDRTHFVRVCVEYGLEVINRPIYLEEKGDRYFRHGG